MFPIQIPGFPGSHISCRSHPLDYLLFVFLSNAGGGGERVLWTAIYWALRQQQEQQQQQQQTGRTKGDTTSTSTSAGTSPGRKIVCVVYSGDYPEASKESILERVHVSLYG